MHKDHAYTQKILEAFGQISQIPRPSKKEEKIVAWMMNWAAENGFETITRQVKVFGTCSETAACRDAQRAYREAGPTS